MSQIYQILAKTSLYDKLNAELNKGELFMPLSSMYAGKKECVLSWKDPEKKDSVQVKLEPGDVIRFDLKRDRFNFFRRGVMFHSFMIVGSGGCLDTAGAGMPTCWFGIDKINKAFLFAGLIAATHGLAIKLNEDEAEGFCSFTFLACDA